MRIALCRDPVLKRVLKAQLLVVIVSIPLAALLSNVTADRLSRPAAQLLSLVAGGRTNNITVDEKGIPSVFINRLSDTYPNPVTVSLYALNYYERSSGISTGFDGYTEKIPPASREENLEKFINTADWLVEHMQFREHEGFRFGVWEYSNRVPAYDMDPPWVSALAQGLGVQVLIRAYDQTGEPDYLKGARDALNALFVDVQYGGVTYKDSSTEWWYEEYAHPGALSSRVLNGMELTLLAIHDYVSSVGDEKARLLFDRGIASLRSNIDRYDAGWWTYYDQNETLANKDYHGLHAALTQKIFEVTSERKFLEVSTKWARYNKPYFIREFMKQKPNYHDLVIVGLNGVGVALTLNVLLLMTLAVRVTMKKPSSKGSGASINSEFRGL
jgi:hypothetical protein